jgi:hypothetical protein
MLSEKRPRITKNQYVFKNRKRGISEATIFVKNETKKDVS